MIFNAYVPHPALQAYVQVYTHVHLITDDVTNINFFPNKISSLSLILTPKPYVKSVATDIQYNNVINFTGQHSKSVIYESASINIVNIVFKPWGAFHLLGIPQQELVNDNFNAVELIPGLKALVGELQDRYEDPAGCIFYWSSSC